MFSSGYFNFLSLRMRIGEEASENSDKKKRKVVSRESRTVKASGKCTAVAKQHSSVDCAVCS